MKIINNSKKSMKIHNNPRPEFETIEAVCKPIFFNDFLSFLMFFYIKNEHCIKICKIAISSQTHASFCLNGSWEVFQPCLCAISPHTCVFVFLILFCRTRRHDERFRSVSCDGSHVNPETETILGLPLYTNFLR